MDQVIILDRNSSFNDEGYNIPVLLFSSFKCILYFKKINKRNTEKIVLGFTYTI